MTKDREYFVRLSVTVEMRVTTTSAMKAIETARRVTPELLREKNLTVVGRVHVQSARPVVR